MADWKDLTRLTAGGEIQVERVRLPSVGVCIEGSFDLPPLAQLTLEDQVFVASFVQSHGSIKEMERLFGVSYPTIKNRLNRISESLGDGLAVQNPAEQPSDLRRRILDRLERGELSVTEAANELSEAK